MRSSLFVPLLAAAAVAAAFAYGCAINTTLGENATNVGPPPGRGDGFGSDESVDGGAPKQDVGVKSASMLCGSPDQRRVSCDPDSTASEQGLKGGCGAPGGTTSSGGALEIKACRVEGTRLAPVPTCGPASTGTEGVTCTTGEDCAAGFDCVDGPDGPTCRRYCCGGKCVGHTSQNGGKTFCDIQQLVALDQNVPVCMPIKACDLLTPGECAANETCAVVTDDGDTGCVAVGGAGVNDPNGCELDHCQAGLTCIGQAGSRKCYELCRMGVANACGPSRECKTSALFGGGEFGICREAGTPSP